jgi:large subunit ribosomal protein L24
MYLKKGDKVVVIAGSEKGKEGTVEKVLSNGKVIIENINMVKKHMKPNAMSPDGGIVEKEMAIQASNVALVDPETGKATRVKLEVKDGKKVRIAKKSGKEI